MNDPLEIIETERLFFSMQCFKSPLGRIGYPEYPNNRAYYNPFIDAFFLPEAIRKSDHRLAQLLEVGHRLLTCTSIKCQMRMFAGIIYHTIYSMLLENKHDPTGMKRWHSLEILQEMLEHLFTIAEPVEEAFSLFYAIRMLNDSDPSLTKTMIEPKELETLALSELDSNVLEAYMNLKHIFDRTGDVGCICVFAALNIDFPIAMFVNDLDDLSDNLPLWKSHLSDPIMNPSQRLSMIADKVDRFPEIALNTSNPTEVLSILRQRIPEIAGFYMGPCLADCICSNTLNGLLRSMHSQSNLIPSPFLYELKLSTRLSNERVNLGETVDPLHLATHLAKTQSIISNLEQPSLTFSSNRCYVRKNIQDIELLALLTTLESIRQQMFMGIALRIPWEYIIVDNSAPFFDLNSEMTKELFKEFWLATRNFHFANDWDSPSFAD